MTWNPVWMFPLSTHWALACRRIFMCFVFVSVSLLRHNSLKNYWLLIQRPVKSASASSPCTERYRIKKVSFVDFYYYFSRNWDLWTRCSCFKIISWRPTRSFGKDPGFCRKSQPVWLPKLCFPSSLSLIHAKFCQSSAWNLTLSAATVRWAVDLLYYVLIIQTQVLYSSPTYFAKDRYLTKNLKKKKMFWFGPEERTNIYVFWTLPWNLLGTI